MQTSFEYWFFYDDDLLLFKQTYLRRCPSLWGKNSTFSLFFVFRWLNIFWNTNVCKLITSLWLNLRAAFAVQIGFPADLSMLAITLTSTVRYSGRLCKNSNPQTAAKLAHTTIKTSFIEPPLRPLFALTCLLLNNDKWALWIFTFLRARVQSNLIPLPSDPKAL